MNSKQKRTVELFSLTLSLNLLSGRILNLFNPVSKSIEWKDIESLFVALGAEVIEGSGSRVRFHKDGVIATFYRPHPKKEAKPYQVKDARLFLEQIGVRP